jgi:hypothetical protein
MADALERLKAYVVPPEECLALLALAKSVAAGAGKPQAQAEAAKPAAPVIETDHLVCGRYGSDWTPRRCNGSEN